MTTLPREPGRALAMTGYRVVAANIAHTSTLRRLFEPRTAPLRARDYIGLTIIFVLAVALAWGFLAATPSPEDNRIVTSSNP